ncbi:hypothetical protein Misp06_03625 [Microbulbifer sp. NBRC 101763]|uniref:hypothetical protein n=1 Tax=Microbulbifer sp. NBRC 101763 TaxID=1113820 RepID=UPI0030A34986
MGLFNVHSFNYFISISLDAYSPGHSGKAKISFLFNGSSNGLLLFARENGSWDNPDNCSASNYLILEKQNPSRSELYSALLASKMSNKEIDVWVRDCIEYNGKTYPKIDGIYTY